MRLVHVHRGAVRTTVRLAGSSGAYVLPPDGRYDSPIGASRSRFIDATSAGPFGGDYDVPQRATTRSRPWRSPMTGDR
ncbi:hypothetical protein B1L11_23670 [Microbispora sp. GKU 823]|nr:hypothetical protein B1L11_23670 [Microbispora sp. GKU 823]